MLQLYLQLLDTEEKKQGFELLYETYRKLMHWVANNILHDEKLAEDAVHEAFLRIIKNFHKINEILCPETRSFVVIIVRNIALNMREKKKPEDEFHEVMEDISFGFDETADEICRKEIIDAILSLSDALKEVVMLYGYFGYTISEIAKLLDITEDAAYKRLQRARNILAQKIERG